MTSRIADDKQKANFVFDAFIGKELSTEGRVTYQEFMRFFNVAMFWSALVELNHTYNA